MFDPKLAKQGAASAPSGEHTMKVSPQDLRQLRFKVVFRGFDRAEVAVLLSAVAADYEQALMERDRLRQDLAKVEVLLNEHRTQERDLRNTLLIAQKLSQDIHATAQAQARQIVSEAEGQSHLLLEKTKARLEDLQRQIDAMKLKRREVETSLESTIASLRSSIEFVREQVEREDRRVLEMPRESEPATASGRQGEHERRGVGEI